MRRFVQKIKTLGWSSVDWPTLIITAWIVVEGGIIAGSLLSNFLRLWRYGAEIELPYLLEALAAGCKLRDQRRLNLYERCGAYFPDMNGPRPPDVPAPAKPKLRAVK